jgi:hypothetical protein
MTLTKIRVQSADVSWETMTADEWDEATADEWADLSAIA